MPKRIVSEAAKVFNEKFTEFVNVNRIEMVKLISDSKTTHAKDTGLYKNITFQTAPTAKNIEKVCSCFELTIRQVEEKKGHLFTSKDIDECLNGISRTNGHIVMHPDVLWPEVVNDIFNESNNIDFTAMDTLEALRFYTGYLIDKPGTGVEYSDEKLNFLNNGDGGNFLDPKTAKKVIGKSHGKCSENAINALCQTLAYHVPYVASHYQLLLGETLPSKSSNTSSEYDQNAADIIIRIAHVLKGSLAKKDNLPFARNRLFTGRVKLLKYLNETVQNNFMATLTSTSLKGIGGIGKTQLALEYAYQYYEQYQYILWVSADGEEVLKKSIADLSSLLQLPDTLLLEDKIKAVQHWLANHSGWLLIVDNAETLKHMDLVSTFFSFHAQGAIIITTRTESPGRFSKSIPVDLFSPIEGGEFLQKRTGRETNTPCDDSIDISIRLDGLALALEQAGAYIEQRGISFAEYLKLYENNSAELLKKSIDCDYAQSAYTTFQLCYEKIKQRNTLACELLEEFSIMPPEGFPVYEVYPKIDELTLLDAIWTLRDYSMITWHNETKIISMHRVVQKIIEDVVLS